MKRLTMDAAFIALMSERVSAWPGRARSSSHRPE